MMLYINKVHILLMYKCTERRIMNKKEEQILNEIIKYVRDNSIMPTMRYLQKKLLFKSVNSITQYIKSLEKQNYLKRNTLGKLILNNYNENTNIKVIKIINTRNDYIHLLLNKNEKYFAYKLHNEFFNNIGLFRNDILIIKKTNKLKNNNLGLFIIDNKYRVMKYKFKDGFYILKDTEELLLNKVKILGKVIMAEKYSKF